MSSKHTASKKRDIASPTRQRPEKAVFQAGEMAPLVEANLPVESYPDDGSGALHLEFYENVVEDNIGLLYSSDTVTYKNDKLSESIPKIHGLKNLLDLKAELKKIFDESSVPDPLCDQATALIFEIVGLVKANKSLDAFVAAARMGTSQCGRDGPEVAPQMWLARENRTETPAEFIQRVYAPWLGSGFTQAHIRRLDKSLYMALHKWLQRNMMPSDLDLPTRKQANDEELLAAGLHPDPGGLDDAAQFKLRLHGRMRSRIFRAKQ